MADLDAKTMKQVNQAVDDFLKKNKGSVDNAREIQAMKSRIVKLEQEVKKLRREVENNKIRAEAAIKDTKKEAEVKYQLAIKSWKDHLRANPE